MRVDCECADGGKLGADARESRLSRAKRLLEKGEPPKAVWMACGFPSPSTFSRQFAAKFDLAPRDFARALRGGG